MRLLEIANVLGDMGQPAMRPQLRDGNIISSDLSQEVFANMVTRGGKSEWQVKDKSQVSSELLP